MSARGMGNCRFCDDRISNVDHSFFVDDGTEVIICGAWSHYMLEHFVTLAPALRQRLLAIDSTTIKSGKTVAYRSMKTLKIFFVEKDDGVHVVGAAVDDELFSHLRELVLRCGGEVPPALATVNATAASVAPSATFSALLAQLKQPSPNKMVQWKAWAEAACHRLYEQLKEVDLEDLEGDEGRRGVFLQLVQIAFLEAGFGAEVIRVIGFVTSLPDVQKEKVLGEGGIGLYRKKHVQLRALANGSNVDIFCTMWSDYDNIR